MKLKKIFVIVFLGICTFSLMGCNLTNDSNVENITFDVEDKNNDIDKIKIKIDAGDILIKNGDNFKVEAANIIKDKYNIKTDEDILYIDYEEVKLGSKNKNADFVITIPDQCKFTDLDMDLGISDVDSHANLTIENSDIRVMAGDISISNLGCSNLDIENHVGDIEIDGKFNGNTSIETNVGDIEITIPNANIDDYNFDFRTRIGEHKINDKKYGLIFNRKNIYASNNIKADCKIGDIKLKI